MSYNKFFLTTALCMLLALPLTILVAKQQQQTQQHAAEMNTGVSYTVVGKQILDQNRNSYIPVWR